MFLLFNERLANSTCRNKCDASFLLAMRLNEFHPAERELSLRVVSTPALGSAGATASNIVPIHDRDTHPASREFIRTRSAHNACSTTTTS
jgi:hypothetical protein